MREDNPRLRSTSRALRRKQTDAERKLWWQLRHRSLGECKFRRQHLIGKYVVDFCSVEKHLIIEVDGKGHMTNTANDQKRTAYLAAKGFRVIRFWDTEVLLEMEPVLEQVRDQLENPHPAPLPQRAREKTR